MTSTKTPLPLHLPTLVYFVQKSGVMSVKYVSVNKFVGLIRLVGKQFFLECIFTCFNQFVYFFLSRGVVLKCDIQGTPLGIEDRVDWILLVHNCIHKNAQL